MGCKGWRVSNIPKVVKMCSITNTAQCPPTPSRRLRALSRPRRRCRPMFTCCHVYLLSVRTLCDPLYLPI